MVKNSRFFLVIFGILFLIFFIYIIYSANQGNIPFFIRQLYMFPGGDKIGHFILLGIFSFFANQLLYPRHLLVFGKSFFIGSLIVMILISVEEVSQIFISNRAFDLIDLSFSYLGIIAGDICVRYLKRKQN